MTICHVMTILSCYDNSLKMLGPISMDDLYIVAKTKDTASQAIDRVIVNVLQKKTIK